MSRKSARIQAKDAPHQPPVILSRKRKVEENEGGDLLDRPAKRHSRQFYDICAVKVDPLADSSLWSRNASERCSKEPLTPLNIHGKATHSRRCGQLTCLSSPLKSFATPSPSRSEQSPARLANLPPLSFANSWEIYESMVSKDRTYVRDHELLVRHPLLHAGMREILLDWLIEVCEVYRLRRETYYLAVDFIDRYMASQADIPKQQLQLIGVSALFLATKLEEIYPPKLNEFAYVTDGACTEDDILEKELVILQALGWTLQPVTVVRWLNYFLQLANVKDISDPSNNFIFPKYSGNIYINVAQLLDLCMLDLESLTFRYQILAAAALHHMAPTGVYRTVFDKLDLSFEDIGPCISWLTPFARALKEEGLAPMKYFQDIMQDDMHNIQTHSVNLQILDKVREKQQQIAASSRNSPLANSGMLTPPRT